MKKISFVFLITIILLLSCSESKLEDWDPYFDIVSEISPLSVNKIDIRATSLAKKEELLITSNENWTAIVNVDWLSLTANSGINTQRIMVDISENNTLNERMGIITITNGSGSVTVNVTQDGKYLTISQDKILFEAFGGTKTVIVETDGLFSVSKDASWIALSSSDTNIRLNAMANTSTDQRSATVTVSLVGLSSGSLSKSIYIVQDAKSGVSIDDYGDLKPLD